jgi:3',5'-cyclic-nucleotide phosphodiesterase
MEHVSPKFTWIALGVEGGLDESSLSAHLVAPFGSTGYICLDAGTMLTGLKAAARNGCFDDIRLPDDSHLSVEGTVLHKHIKAYLITHPYLDHVEGLMAISPNDVPKPIMSLPGSIENIKTHLFNWHVWPNLCNEGAPPALGQYTYVKLQPGKRAAISDTSMSVEAYPLAHGHTESTAFLIESEGSYILYMGDTGPDEVEKRSTTHNLWIRVAPLIKTQCLRGIFIEASYPDDRPDNLLFSHLTPAWLMHAFKELAALVDVEHPQEALRDLTVIISHIKPDLSAGTEPREVVKRQLHEHNNLGLRFIFAQQGNRYEL